MQLKRKIGLVASLASLLLALPVAAQGADSQARGLNWRSDKDALPGTVMYSQIRQGSADVSTACVGGFNDKNCDAKTASLLVNNFLPTCDLEKVLDCIDTVSWIKSDGTVVAGKQTKVRGSAWDDYAYARNETLRVNKPTLPSDVNTHNSPSDMRLRRNMRVTSSRMTLSPWAFRVFFIV